MSLIHLFSIENSRIVPLLDSSTRGYCLRNVLNATIDTLCSILSTNLLPHSGSTTGAWVHHRPLLVLTHGIPNSSTDELAALNVIPRTTSESSTSDTGSISSQEEPIDGDTETASRSQYEDSENEVALSTPTRSGYSPQKGSSPMSSLQRLAQAPTFSSPLSVISEEVQTPEPLKASRARVPNPSEIDDSPLRIPHPTTNDASKFESDRPSTKTPNKRSPSPPQPASIGSSKYASPQPPTFSGPRVSGSSENETQGPQRSIATSYLSKESFKSLIQDCMPIPDAATLQIADTIKVDDGDRQEEQNKGAPKPGSSISVGSLRKVFEKSGNGSRSKRNR